MRTMHVNLYTKIGHIRFVRELQYFFVYQLQYSGASVDHWIPVIRVGAHFECGRWHVEIYHHDLSPVDLKRAIELEGSYRSIKAIAANIAELSRTIDYLPF